jgi:hypothetical protein
LSVETVTTCQQQNQNKPGFRVSSTAEISGMTIGSEKMISLLRNSEVYEQKKTQIRKTGINAYSLNAQMSPTKDVCSHPELSK